MHHSIQALHALIAGAIPEDVPDDRPVLFYGDEAIPAGDVRRAQDALSRLSVIVDVAERLLDARERYYALGKAHDAGDLGIEDYDRESSWGARHVEQEAQSLALLLRSRP